MTAKIGPHVKLLAANIIQKLMPIEDGNEHVFYELCGIIADHVPNHEWEAKEKALRVFILRNADHGVDDTGEYCRAGAFTRTVFEDGTAEVYPCTCGLDELRAILNREQEKP